MTPQQRAEHASRLLEDPLVKEAFEMVEKQILDSWESCPARDVEGREYLWRFLKTTRKFKDVFIGVIQSGRLAPLREKKVKNG